MFATKAIPRVDKFLLSSCGESSQRSEEDLERYNEVIRNPRVRVIKEETEKETEKQYNDKGVQVSSVDYLYKIVTWTEDTL